MMSHNNALSEESDGNSLEIDRFLASLEADRACKITLTLTTAKSKEDVEKVVDQLHGALIEIVEGKRKDPRTKIHVSPGNGKEAGVIRAKEEINTFAQEAKKRLERDLERGQITAKSCRVLKRKVVKLKKEVTHYDPDNQTKFQSLLATRIRYFCKLCLDNIKIQIIHDNSH